MIGPLIYHEQGVQGGPEELIIIVRTWVWKCWYLLANRADLMVRV